MIRVGVIWINMNWVGIFLILNNRFILPRIFNLIIIFELRILICFVASKVFTFTFSCTMPRRSPIIKILRPYDGVKYVAVSCTVRLWDSGNYGSLWVHPIAVINFPPRSGNISTAIQTPEGGIVPILVSQYGLLVWFEDDWLNIGVCLICYVSPEWVCDNYQELYRPSYFSRQLDLSRLFRTCHHIPSDTFPSGVVSRFVSCIILLR